MSRGFGEAAFASELPDVAVAAAGVVTQLGDMWFVLVAVGALAVAHRAGLPVSNDPWRDCLFLFAVAVGSYSFTLVLKHLFLLPRPPGAATATPPAWLPDLAGAAYESMVTGDGYGFPSGHALKTTVVYGGAAATLTVWDARRRFAAAGVVTVAVALSRVVLGVHYLVDVLAGVVVGAAFLVLVIRATDRHPGYTFGLAAVLGLLAFGASSSAKAALAAGVAVCGAALWTFTDRSQRAALLARSAPVAESDEEL